MHYNRVIDAIQVLDHDPCDWNVEKMVTRLASHIHDVMSSTELHLSGDALIDIDTTARHARHHALSEQNSPDTVVALHVMMMCSILLSTHQNLSVWHDHSALMYLDTVTLLTAKRVCGDASVHPEDRDLRIPPKGAHILLCMAAYMSAEERPSEDTLAMILAEVSDQMWRTSKEITSRPNMMLSVLVDLATNSPTELSARMKVLDTLLTCDLSRAALTAAQYPSELLDDFVEKFPPSQLVVPKNTVHEFMVLTGIYTKKRTRSEVKRLKAHAFSRGKTYPAGTDWNTALKTFRALGSPELVEELFGATVRGSLEP